MLHEPPFWQIGRPLRRPFSVRATIFTYFLIIICMFGITGFTIYTKGYVIQCNKTMYKSTDPGLNNPSVFDSCQPASLYPGQTLSLLDFTFTYEAIALGNWTKPYALEHCELHNTSWLSSFHFPSSDPVLTFDMNFICTTKFTPSEGDPVTTYYGIPIYSNTAVLGIKSAKGIPDDPNEFWTTFRRVQKDLKDANIVCARAPLTGFRVFGDSGHLNLSWISDNADASICYAQNANPWPVLDTKVLEFYNKTIELAKKDLITTYPLPNLIFECPYCTKGFIPPTQLAWNIAVGLGSTWSLVLLISTTIVARVSNSYDRSYDVWVEAVQVAQSSPNTPGTGSVSSKYKRGHDNSSPLDESAQYLLATSTPQNMTFNGPTTNRYVV